MVTGAHGCLQELKSLLLEAQKGPESLQEALRVQAVNHRSQQDQLRTLIDDLKGAVQDTAAPRGDGESPRVPLPSVNQLHISSRRAESLLKTLLSQATHLGGGLGRVESDLSAVRKLLEQQQVHRPERGGGREPEAVGWNLEDTQRTLGEQMKQSSLVNAAVTYSATAVTIAAVYLLLRGAG